MLFTHDTLHIVTGSNKGEHRLSPHIERSISQRVFGHMETFLTSG